MNKKEMELLEQIRSSAEEIQVPASLSPEELPRMLESRKKENARNMAAVFRGIRGKQIMAAAAGLLLICLAGAAFELAGQRTDRTDSTMETAAEDGTKTASDYEDIYAYLEDYQKEHGQRSGGSGRVTAGSAAQESAEAYGSAASGTASDTAAQDYSDTNLRQEGVGEADVVKTDGRYIYTLSASDCVSIVDTQGGMEETGRIPEERQILEFYVSGDRLLLLVSGQTGEDFRTVRESSTGTDSINLAEDSGVVLLTYDISERNSPRKIGELSQSGSYLSSRLVGDYLYIFSSFSPDLYAGREERETYVPSAGGSLIPEQNIYLPDGEDPSRYLVMTALDIKQPDRLTDSKAVFAGTGQLYVSGKNIYWYENASSNILKNETQETVIRKFSYRDGTVEAVAKGTVKGRIDDSFSIDEYKDTLRVVTTDEKANGLYILDENLVETGRIQDLAEGEQVYAARFFGDTGYFVTFRNTDPLFSVDLSDPAQPKVLGKLKIPGFSDYLHGYGEQKLLGIGMEVDEETGTTEGMKLSMFDTSDPGNVKEDCTYVLENVYSADVLYDYKAALVDAERNLIGFSCYEGAEEVYCLFSYDEKEGFIRLMKETVNGTSLRSARGLYIGSVLYIVKGNIIEAYNMENYEKTDDLIL